MSIILTPLNPQYHEAKNFREQIAVLYVGHSEGETVDLLRSYTHVCLPGAASFDPARPGADSAESWEYINTLIEKEHVIGIFHTHPQGVIDFSGQDWAAMKAFAMANGKKYLFYGVQSLAHPCAHFVCLNMLSNKVICHDYGQIASDPDNIVIRLPLPQRITAQDGMLVMPAGY